MSPRWTSLIHLFLLAVISPTSSAEILVGENGVFQDHTLAANAKQKGQTPPPLASSVGDDLVLFSNGDLMHGTFSGIDQGLLWQRTDIDRPIKFAISSLKQIVFNSTRRLPLDQDTSFITLSSGDRIPGKIVTLDEKNLTLKSPVIGLLEIPRTLIQSISPNPFGGKLYFLGPYHSDGWLTLEPIKEAPESSQEKAADKTPDKELASSWIHSGTAFYSQGTHPLILADAQLPDTGRLSFTIAWKGRLSFALSLHSDLTRVLPAKPQEDDKNLEENEGDPGNALPPAPLTRENILDLRKGKTFQSIPWIKPQKKSHSDLFGTGYTLSLQSGYPTLTRNYFSETGTPRQTPLNTTRSNTSLGESGEALIELRFNREKSLIMLYINGVYSNQWHDLSGYLGQGSALGFINRSPTSKIRISELIVSSWDGATDSARSMEHPERDIIHLSNGTDRYSGTLASIREGQAHIKTDYSELHIPLSELSLINFNKASLLDLETDENLRRFRLPHDAITVAYQPFGLLKLSPLSATTTTLTGRSPFLGEITIDLSSAIHLNFSDDSPDLSSWFEDF